MGKIATLAGRYYGMDRDKRWERIEKAYQAIVLGQGETGTDPRQVLEDNYAKEVTDEFVKPTVILSEGKPIATIDDNDAAIFYNFRVDRPRELTMALVMPNFEHLDSMDFGYNPFQGKNEGEVKLGSTFTRQKQPKNLFFVTMTEYQKGIPVSGIAFGPELVEDSFPYVLTQYGLKHMHMAESEKERFVTYYFNGMREEPFEGEARMIIPSPKVATYDKKPEMSVYELVEAFKKQLATDAFDFFVINFANPDMVAHTGKIDATVKAIEHVDWALNEMEQAICGKGGTLMITADHGNAEELLTMPQNSFFYTSEKGDVNTEHSSNKVPLLVINSRFKGKLVQLPLGASGDVAPTMLALLGLPKAAGMTGKNLLEGTGL